MTQIAAGQQLGRYELLVPIAKGGMAQVWAARLKGSRGFHKLVAIKTVLPRSLDDERMERMFLEEASVASQVHHPNVVETLELGEQDGVLYLVMEWVEGEPLGEVIIRARDHGGLPLGIGVNLIGQALKGLSAAHNARDENAAPLGLVHRDISPQNVLVTYAGLAKLVDFGIAKATSRASGLTSHGEVKGKFAYMSPEQVRGELVDARTDVFAMGILLYVVTTGHHPFKGNSPAETVARITGAERVTRPIQWIPEYPSELEGVLLKSLEKSTVARYSSAQEMLVALERALPQAFELSAEIRVAEYIKGLLAEKVSQRRTTIRMAKEFIERMRESSSSSSQSFSSLRGISIEQTPSTGSLPTPLRETQSPPAPTPNREQSSTTVSRSEPPPKRRWPLTISALSAIVLSGVAVVRVTAPSLLTSITNPAAAVAPPEAPRALAPAPPPAPQATADPAASAHASYAAEREKAEPKADIPATKDAGAVKIAAAGRAKRPPARRVFGRTANAGAGAVTGAPAAAAAAPAAKASSEPAQAPNRPAPTSNSAWDPGAFGGRQ